MNSAWIVSLGSHWPLSSLADMLPQFSGRFIEFKRPEALFLLGALIFFWIAMQRSRSAGAGRRAILFAARAITLCSMVLAISQPVLIHSGQPISLALLIDASASVESAELERALDQAAKILEARGGAEARLIFFGEQPLFRAVSARSDKPLRTALDEMLPERGNATDIEAALRLAMATAPPDRIDRIVLFSDGLETRGDVAAAVADVAAAGTRIYVFPLDFAKPEVAVAELRLPAEARIGEKIDVQARILSNFQGSAQLTLFRDDKAVEERTVTLEPGLNIYSFKQTVEAAASFSYRLECRPERDAWMENNSARALLVTGAAPRVLIMDSRPDTARYLKKALEAHGMRVELRSEGAAGKRSAAGDLVEELKKFDLVVLADYPARRLSNDEMSALARYVEEHGGGLIMAGGEESFGPGGYRDTPIERVLPVHCELELRRQMPSLALILVIDKSGSMIGKEIELVKEAAKQALGRLGARDYIGVLAFDSSFVWVVEPQQLGNQLEAIRSKISTIAADGGTNIYPALEEAYKRLSSIQAKAKHLILLSDGHSSAGDYSALVDKIAAEKITVSTVAVGEQSDRELLGRIASRGQGRAYFIQDASSVPRIFIKEVEMTLKALEEEPFTPAVTKQVELTSGIDFSHGPPLLGYVIVRPKPEAEIILRSPRGDPLLARWRIGLGKTAAFASDFKNRWAARWLEWPGYARFWSQLAYDVMRPRSGGPEISLSLQGGRGLVSIKDEGNGRSPKVRITAPDGSSRSFEPEESAPGVYSLEFAAEFAPGSDRPYVISIEGGQANGRRQRYLFVPYHEEQRAFGTDRRLLRELARSTGGKVSPQISELLDPGKEKRLVKRELRATLLIFALIAFLAELSLRRFARAGLLR